MEKINKCPYCGNDDFVYDKMDLMGDGVEEHFGKTIVICSDTKNCGKIVEYID